MLWTLIHQKISFQDIWLLIIQAHSWFVCLRVDNSADGGASVHVQALNIDSSMFNRQNFMPVFLQELQPPTNTADLNITFWSTFKYFFSKALFDSVQEIEVLQHQHCLHSSRRNTELKISWYPTFFIYSYVILQLISKPLVKYRFMYP